MSDTKAIILLGAPGAGKGTMAEAVKRARADIVHISTGDMLREEIKCTSELGRAAESYMQRGQLVPDDLIVKMVMQRLADGGSRRYMFDGFPRTLPQAELLDANFQTRGFVLAAVLLLEVSAAVCLDRLTGRRVCRHCGANYHVRNIPPRTPGVCDRCGGELYQRPDDMPETIEKRLQVFQQQTAALVDYYAGRCILERIDSGRDPQVTVADIMKVLQQRGF